MLLVWVGAALTSAIAIAEPFLGGAVESGGTVVPPAWVDAAAERTASEEVASSELRSGDVVVVSAGELIPGDGDIVWGIATVDESAITGESAPVVRESGGDRSAVTGGTRVLSDRIVVRITSKPGETFVDRMIALVEGPAGRRPRTRSR